MKTLLFSNNAEIIAGETIGESINGKQILYI